MKNGAMRIRQATLDEVGSWDTIVRRFPNYRLPHTRAWIDALVADGCGQPLFLMLEQDGEVVGALPGLIRRVGRWRLFGSPLAGWQTVSQGPAYDPERFSAAAFASALTPYLEREHGVDHVELMHTGLDAEAMRGAGFAGESVPTFKAPLFPGDAARTLKQLKDSARRNVKRAQRLGLTVRFEHDERFVDEHYDQVTEVYHRGGYTVPFTKQRVLEMFRRLRDAGNLVALSVYLPGGRTNIATGLFFIEGKELLLWMWAHREHYRWYRPTELMTWAAMERAVERGCDTFDLMGRGDFKAKFGAEPDATKTRWLRSRSRWLQGARKLASIGYYAQQAVRGRFKKLARRLTHRVPNGTPALVLGDIDLVRPLGRAGIPSVVLADPGSAARYSRHTRGVLPFSDRAPVEQVVDALVRYGERQPEPPVLFYEDDHSLRMISRFRDRLREAFRFVVPDAGLVEALADKARFHELAARLQLPVPATRIVQPAREPLPADFPLAFPLALKPVTKSPAGWDAIAGGGKATAVASLAELQALWPRLAAANMSLVVQELVPGPETCMESYHVYVDERGHIAGEFTGRKIRTWPAAYGDSTALETTDAPDVLALGRALVKKLKLRGVAKFDFKRGPQPEGRLYLLEVNPRFNLWHHLGAAAGVNLPALVYADLTGQPRPEAVQARAGTQWCKPWKDFAAARALGMSLASWIPWALRVDAMSAAAWGDPFPLVRAGLWRGVAALKRKIAGQFAGGSTGEPPLPLHVPTRSDV
jgi:D-aspartate ligase